MPTFRRGLTPLLCLALLALGTASQPKAPAGGDALRAALAAERARPRAPLLPRAAFLSRSDLADVALSPQGREVAWLRRTGNDRSLWLLAAAGGAPRLLLRHSEAERLHWSADGGWLFLESQRQLFALPLRGQAGGGVLAVLDGRQRRHLLRPDPAAPGAVLVVEEIRPPGALRPIGWRLLRLAPASPPRSLLRSAREILDFVPGRDGGPAFVKLAAPDGSTIAAIAPRGGLSEVLRCGALDHCGLLSSPAPGELLLSSAIGGNLEQLVRRDGAGVFHLVHEDPLRQSDLDEVELDPVTGRPLIATYRSAAAASYALVPEMRPHLDAIRRALRGGDFRIAAGSGPGARWLVTELGERLQQPRWHVYDPATRRLTEILTQVERRARTVPEAIAARRTAFAYRATDGFLLHGFLAVPPGADPAHVPLVVLVHGGPWAHVSAGYASLTQFLINRGYAVFEPNFRGSTGYGRLYQLAGGSDFGDGRVQQDVIDGTHYLLAQGVGDPGRVGLVGSSFGGYSALLGITFAPDLFRVAVAAMPPADFGWVVRWQLARERLDGRPGLAASLRALAFDPADAATAARLAAQSPLANVARLRRPLLLVAGGRDESVPLRSVIDYAARLGVLHRDVSLLVEPNSGHRMETPETQAQYLYALERMLAAHLGGPPVAPPAAETAAGFRRNLRLAGSAFTRSG